MTLQEIGLKHETDKATFHKYCDFYQKHLPKRGFKGRLLEIGVMDGASLKMWKEYYPKAEIIGIDINEKTHLDIDGVTILKIDGTDPKAIWPLGKFDIIIDDGSHFTKDQIISFQWLYYMQLNEKGLYVLEDLHTSNMPNYVNTPFTTLDWLKLKNLKAFTYQRDNKTNDSISWIIKAGQ